MCSLPNCSRKMSTSLFPFEQQLSEMYSSYQQIRQRKHHKNITTFVLWLLDSVQIETHY